ncbi:MULTISPECIES: YlmH/Sll1252 family protein [Psychrilyobacter]|uniref:RNA-binding protein n=1 Tax=Psychrilyobacter piezotolerans TaxID=2293438 RepID=A0ABX9KEQ9_9FUSO|nr:MULTISPECIES: YlmH/Sll1252 family protein [Psychrilyobacter]MCS5422249.1 YlmH/Sll1252 family protein [Psychrilyobacter sp. S5]NDI78763.1 RNA-binding protein [Psychrilyobacter piezotolerans]RDE59611.1 RNA-binding protein [Psychrilyobacter sp. S5]REI40025.1 RNA-binding protein [Psychrilyobacter piezotolerans]
MDKKKFKNYFIGEDEGIISSIYDKIELCKKTDGTIYTDIFLPPQIWSKLVQIEAELGILVEVNGLSMESEKKMAAFKSYYSGETLKFPSKLIVIKNNSKFNKLEHRHYLAGILSTGIKREKLGDLIVEDENCYTVISDGLFEFLKLYLLSIGKSKVEIEEVGDRCIPQYRFEVKEYLINSCRLDVIVSALINGSRNEALKMIGSSQVMVNYGFKTDKSLSVKEGDVISIRRYGKHIFIGSTGETKKGKIKGKFKKYI